MKKLLLTAAIAIMLTGCSGGATDPAVNTDHQSPPVDPAISVETALVGENEITGDLKVPGQVKADEIQSVSAVVSGQIDYMTAEVGDDVKKGENLVKLDDTLVSLKKRQAEIGSKMYQLALDSAQRTYNRTQSLYESNSATEAQIEEATDYLTKAQLDIANQNVTMDELNYQLNHMTIKAPISGIISKKYQQIGVTVGPGTPLFDIVDISVLTVESGVTEKDVSRLEKGQVVSVSIPSLGMEVNGTVKAISPVSGEDQTYPVMVEIENVDLKIKPGMFAEMKIITDAPRKVISLPKVAILNEDGINYVYVVESAHAVKKEVTLGTAFDEHFEVLSGISVGDEIVISGQAYLEDGSSVDVVK